MSRAKPSELTRLIKAFFYSWQGLKVAVGQPAFRLEVMAALVLIPAGMALGSDNVERALLAGSVLLVLIVELVNTAIETAIDRISTERHELSGRAKNLGSAAVLVALANAGIIWTLILFF